MKKLAASLLIVAVCQLAACRAHGPSAGQPPAPSGATQVTSSGATSPRAAVESFLGAVRAEDLQALSLIWGTPDGPARALMSRDELEKRELVMLCHLRHESFRILDDAIAANNTRAFTVELTRAGLRRTTTFVAVPAKNGHWYVQSADLEPMRDFCARR